MTTKFEGKERQIIIAKQPQPKVFQVWQHVFTGKLQTIYDVEKVNKEVVAVFFEDETQYRFKLGCGFLNGKDYRFVGFLF